MDGIAIGTVADNWDKDHPGTVQVNYLLGKSGEMKTDWIPVMTGFGGASYGAYHLPEVGNSVVIGFEQGNANRPVVLGCLWNQDNPLPKETANENNSKLLWRTKGGYSFFVEEKDKILSFSDPEGKNTVVWSTADKCLTVDVEEKAVFKVGGEEFFTLEKGKMAVSGPFEVTAESVTVRTEKDFCAEASGETQLKGKNITLTPQQNTTVKGIKTEIAPSQGVTVKAQQIAAEGTTLELKAQASGKLQSGGILEVKGSMLKLN